VIFLLFIAVHLGTSKIIEFEISICCYFFAKKEMNWLEIIVFLRIDLERIELFLKWMHNVRYNNFAYRKNFFL